MTCPPLTDGYSAAFTGAALIAAAGAVTAGLTLRAARLQSAADAEPANVG